MADDKNGREKQARDAERRQQKREVATELERGDEPEPSVDAAALSDFVAELEALEFPATGTEVVAAFGDRTIESAGSEYRIADLVPDVDAETFDSPTAVRAQVVRPTIAAAMKRVVEASKTIPHTEISRAQRNAYVKTFEELEAIEPDDDDAGIRAISDWIIEQIRDREALPSSRAVRREAAKFCRANGSQVRNDEWLGI